MQSLKPAGTFNGNPVGTAAALATIAELEKPGVYERLHKLTGMLVDGFRELGKKHGIKVYVRNFASVFVLYFGFDEDVDDLREWLSKADAFFLRMEDSCQKAGET